MLEALTAQSPVLHVTGNINHELIGEGKGADGPTMGDLAPEAVADYARVLGLLLAKSHARTSGASRIAGYLGNSDAAAEAFANFARAYADQTEADHAALLRAVQAGRLPIDESADAK